MVDQKQEPTGRFYRRVVLGRDGIQVLLRDVPIGGTVRRR